VINEINYNPVGFGIEFIELKNITGQPVQLFDPANPANVWRFTDAIGFDFPQGATIPANGYAIVSAVDPVAFRAAYNVPAGVQVWGPFLGNLDNAGESVELSRPGVPDAQQIVPYYRVDKISYDGAAPWPAAANGTGPTLSRIVAANYGNDAGNWTTYGSGGTPGQLNNAIAPTVTAGGNVTISPGGTVTRNGSFADASPGETWTATVSWGDVQGETVPLALNPDKTFSLSHTYPFVGSYTVVVRVEDSNGAFGTSTFQVNVVDTTPPQALQSFFDWSAAPHRLKVLFSENVAPSLVVEDLQLVNRTTGATVPSANVQLAYDAQTNTATFSFVGLPDNVLPDGDYRATILATDVRDGGNSPLVSNVTVNFHVYAGDINRDRQVNFTDLVPLAQHYNTTGGMTFADGDLNYDGNVDFNDLVILAQRYNQALGTPVVPAEVVLASPPPALAAMFASAKATAPTAPVVPIAPAKPKPVAKPQPVKQIFSTTPVKKPAAPSKPVAKLVARR
jgi:hypothetical protein